MPRTFKVSLAAVALFLSGCFSSESRRKDSETIQTDHKPGTIILSGFCIAPPKESIFGRQFSTLPESKNLGLEVQTKERFRGSKKKSEKFYTFNAIGRRGELFVEQKNGKEVIASIELSPPWELSMTENAELNSDLTASELKTRLASRGQMNADDGNIRYIDPLGVELNITVVGERALLISASQL